MPSEKFFVHKEDGSLVRLKGRLVRFLDEEPPTGSDKSAIRTALEVSPDAEGLVQADVGTDPNQLVLHQHLGDISYQSSDSVSVDTLEVTDKVDGSLGIDVTPTASKLEVSGTTNSSLMMTRTSSGIVSNLEDAAGYGSLLLYQAGGSAKVSIQGNGDSYFNGGNVGIGGSPSYDLHVSNSATSSSIGITGSGGSKDTWTVTSTDSGGKAVLNFRDEDTSTTVLQLHQDNKLVLSSGGGIDFGSAAASGRTVESGLLSDYESGTWTVTTDGDATGTIGNQYASYTKVGRLVTVRAVFSVTANFTSNSIGGLPFDVEAPSGSASSVSTGGIVLNNNSADSPVTCHSNHNQSYVKFRVGTNVNLVHNPNTTGAVYRLQFSYETA